MCAPRQVAELLATRRNLWTLNPDPCIPRMRYIAERGDVPKVSTTPRESRNHTPSGKLRVSCVHCLLKRCGEKLKLCMHKQYHINKICVKCLVHLQGLEPWTH